MGVGARPGGLRLVLARLGSLLRLKRTAYAFARSQDGGAVLVGGAIVLLLMTGTGAMMTNYAWREAQWEELRAATRAAVSAAGPLLAGAGGAADEQIKERIASFTTALLPGLTVAADDVVVSYDADTNTTTITVVGDYDFQGIWGFGGGDADVESVVRARLEAERYEVAMALDVSISMNQSLPDGVKKLAALQAAVTNVADTLETTSATTPGSVLVSVVPYSAAVNVADTCNPDPDTGACRAARSPGKERYVRMLAGVRDTMAKTLADARTARDNNTGGHWVDTFHHYGAGTGLGALRRQYLPTDLLDDRDWNLRREDVAIDVSVQVPSLGTWTVDDADFWSGCVMARWGAYWNTAARSPGWTQDAASNWPAATSVGAWSSGGTGLAGTTPLYLSDAPPDASAPNTLFTAYSWPDARIRGRADEWMQETMIELLHPGVLDWTYRAVGDNDWSIADNGGDVFCPRVPITPLTDDLALLRRVSDSLTATPAYVGGGGTYGATFMNLGITWGLRTLSPLWQDVWDVTDVRNVERPAVPCAPGEDPPGCDPELKKSILLLSDGASWVGGVAGSRLLASWNEDANPGFSTESRCRTSGLSTYRSAGNASNPADFNGYFRSPEVTADLVDADGRLNADGREAFADAFLSMAGTEPDTPTRRGSILSALATADSGAAATPWQVFRGLDSDVVDVLVDSTHEFGFDGRPTLIGQRCRPTSTFSPFGRADDLVYVGDVGPDAMTPPRPIADVAPFEVTSLPAAVVGDGSPGSFDQYGAAPALSRRIDDWLLEACAVAGARRVRINVVFIGNSTSTRAIELLEDCVDAAGGDPDVDEVFVTPTSAALKDAFERIFTIRRNLRFLD